MASKFRMDLEDVELLLTHHKPSPAAFNHPTQPIFSKMVRWKNNQHRNSNQVKIPFKKSVYKPAYLLFSRGCIKLNKVFGKDEYTFTFTPGNYGNLQENKTTEVTREWVELFTKDPTLLNRGQKLVSKWLIKVDNYIAHKKEVAQS